MSFLPVHARPNSLYARPGGGFGPDVVYRRSRDTGITPTDIPDLAIWWDADDDGVFTLDPNVSQWNDKSGNNLHLTAPTESQQPVRASSESGVAFSVSAEMALDAPSSTVFGSLFASGGHVFYVLNPNITASEGFARWLYTHFWKIYQVDSDTLRFIHDFNTTDGEWHFDVTENTKFLLDISYDGDDVANDPAISIDGAGVSVSEEITPEGTAFSGATPFYLMGQNTFGQAEGIVYEVLLFDAIKSGGEYASIINYLKNKWSIS